MITYEEDLVSLDELRSVLNAHVGPYNPRQRPARQGLRRLRPALLAAIVAVGLVGVGVAIAATATGWLAGTPAPQTVVSNFGTHAPQLGSPPNAHGSVLVAADGDVSLYAATASGGGYCILVSTPWNPATTNEGGNCYAPTTTANPLVAFSGGARPNSTGGFTAVVAGRVASAEAQSVRFTAPDGSVVSRQVGSSGFFVAAFHLAGTRCDHLNGWTPTITALDAHGAVVAQTRQADLIGMCVTAPNR